jgi:hypothetical protein
MPEALWSAHDSAASFHGAPEISRFAECGLSQRTTDPDTRPTKSSEKVLRRNEHLGSQDRTHANQKRSKQPLARARARTLSPLLGKRVWVQGQRVSSFHHNDDSTARHATAATFFLLFSTKYLARTLLIVCFAMTATLTTDGFFFFLFLSCSSPPRHATAANLHHRHQRLGIV